MSQPLSPSDYGFTSKFTAEPAVTFCPGAGFCVMMMLTGEGCDIWAGAGLGDVSPLPVAGCPAMRTVPRCIPASCNACVTLPSG